MGKITKIKKRDDRIVDYDLSKVEIAIYKAMEAVGDPNKKKAKKLALQVEKELNKKFHERSIPAVEEIQDFVEEILIRNRQIKTAKAYILYREQHAQIRDLKSLIDSDALMEGYLAQSDWRVKENSNMAYSLQGLNNHVASAVSAHYWLHKVYPQEVRDAHANADIHIHDLQTLAAYCCGWDLRDLLMKGFGGVMGKVSSKPAKHFRTALGHIVNFFYTLQGETAGAQAFSSFDTYLAPFVAYDNLTYPEVKQCIQEFLFNMNVPTRVGFQTPFTNITMDLVVPEMMKDEPVVIGGKFQDKTHKDFQKEMDMINIAFTEVMTAGDASSRVFTFPIPTYNITKDFNWGSEVVEKIMEMTAKYGIPYFSNFINSDMKPEDARSMCCRLRLDNRELRKRGGGLFAANPLTGSIGVVTVNLPRLGYVAKDKKEFMERLEKMMKISKESLDSKRKVVEKFTDDGLYPYSRFYLQDIKAKYGEYWKNHFNTIGINGMNEAAINLLGNDLTTKEGHEFAKEVLDFMRERLMDYQLESNNLYNLEATPAEGTAYRFAKADKAKYPDIIVANERAYRENGADPYYTNSSQLPVDYTDDIFEALDLQDDLQTRYTGGTVLHGFIGEKMPSAESTKKLVKKIAENYHLPYYTITPTFSVCPVHGYIEGEHFFCPKCDSEIGFVERTNALANKII
ncbi:MAG: ribonucleoside triphosphate reductase [Candidatus Buchananbacteria bacterium RBG_13_36_9]|uniref:Ribonucleoside triphosphate reductase n=1 Tax=Candidatus Buchananbacteria bacterium RBG_13_36_9 TaxID=1797530 RepID=A0A1G1XRA8_9BACT|nr:MAG: ribonucleoside triphosphate reductase [Candidatus Buchananbacteria bacterium RBG_13_36_9]